jgi:hypothetical protein
MTEKNRKYLENLKDAVRKLKDHPNVAEMYMNVGKGYIKGMVDCGVIENFKETWDWFKEGI